MKTIRLGEVIDDHKKIWFESNIKEGSAFPDERDGLKDSSRSVLYTIAKGTDFGKKAMPAQQIPSEASLLRGIRDANIEKVLFKMSLGNTPLVEFRSNKEAYINTSAVNRITGNNVTPTYVVARLTPLGMYAFKYRDYFEKTPGVNGEMKYTYLKTPIPLLLLLPQTNLMDGISNLAPNINILNVIDAYLLHLQKDKKTTTEELARLIKGFEVDKGSRILMTNQGLRDMIERGACSATIITPIEVYDDRVVINALPYRQTGATLKKEFATLIEKKAFKTFTMKRWHSDDSKDCLIFFYYSLKTGCTKEDMIDEIYAHTQLKQTISYENICCIPNTEKPLHLRSIRQVLDYHVDLGIELKTADISRQIEELREEYRKAVLYEKFTRHASWRTVGRLIGEKNKLDVLFVGLNGLYEQLNNKHKIANYQYPEQYKLLAKTYDEIYEYIVKECTRQHGVLTEETWNKTMEVEVVKEFTKDEIKEVFSAGNDILKRLDKRKDSLVIIKDFLPRLEEYREKLKFENIKQSLREEILELRSKYTKKGNLSINLYAKREAEKAEVFRQEAIQKIKIEETYNNVPVNVIRLKDGSMKLSIDATEYYEDTEVIYETTIESRLVGVTRKGKNKVINVNSLTFEFTKPFDDDEYEVITTLSKNIDSVIIMATNKGKVAIATRSFIRTKRDDMGIDDDERIIFVREFPQALLRTETSIALITKDKKMKASLLRDLKLKAYIGGFFNLFTGVSSTTEVESACIFNALSPSISCWDNGHKTGIFPNPYKRNVSRAVDLMLDSEEVNVITHKVPVARGKVIVNLNLFSPTAVFNVMSPILQPIRMIDEMAKFNGLELEEITWINREIACDRMIFKEVIEFDDVQVMFFKQRFSKEKGLK